MVVTGEIKGVGLHEGNNGVGDYLCGPLRSFIIFVQYRPPAPVRVVVMSPHYSPSPNVAVPRVTLYAQSRYHDPVLG